MLNIIKMDFYRMLKSKSQYILWILLTVMLVLTTASMREEYKDPQASANNWETMQEGVEDTAENLGMYVTVPTEPGQKATLYDMFYANMQGKVEAIFIVIFAVLFATADIRSGYIKNIGGQCRRRSDLVISKAVILFLYTVLTFLLTLAVQAFCNAVFYGYLEIGPVSEFLGYIGTQLLLHYALALIVMGISILILNNIISMTLAIMLCMNMTVLLWGMVGRGLQSVFDRTVDVLSYTVTGSISILQLHGDPDLLIKAALVAIAYGTVFTVVSAIVFQRRDIR